MSKKPRMPLTVEVGLSAGAHLDVKAEVPTSSVGRFVDSITDLFRPFSEARGLQADQIRMQRAEVAIEIAKRARAALAIENMEVSPVPNKILIPLIEKCSNEEITDDFMIDKWSNLLANASISSDVGPRFVGILGEMRGRQARALDAIARNGWSRFEKPVVHLADADAWLESVNIRKFLNDLFFDKRFSPQVNDLYSDLINVLNVPGGAIVDIIIFDGDNDGYSLAEPDRLRFDDTASLI